MLKDIGFWNAKDEYIEDYQEIDEMEMKEGTYCYNCGAKLASTYAEKEIIKRLEQENAELKAENERLKEEIETRDNLIDHFRDDALYWATIANKYQKDKTKLEKTLQEIKTIAEFHITDADSEDVQNDMKQILDLITKAEEGE